MVKEGYVPDMNYGLRDVEDSEKIKMINHHSENLERTGSMKGPIREP